MFACEISPDGDYLHSLFNEIHCWEGFHIIHAVCSLLVSTIFVGICLVVALTCFETKSCTNEPSAR